MQNTMVLNKLRDQFTADGFCCNENLDLGAIRADLFASRKTSLLLLPYFDHCYFFNCSMNSPATIQQIVGFHSLACAHTDRFKNKRTRWLRFRVPITLSVIISEYGFDNLAIENVSKKKQRYQMGNVNAIMLIDLSQMQFHKLGKVGFVGCLPFWHVNKLIKKIATNLEVVNNDT